MNKKKLIDDIAKRAELSKADAGLVLKAFLDAITETMIKGQDVSLVGFGNFGVTAVPKRVGRNPRTLEEITINAHKKITFKPGKNLKDAVN
ncbi:MULTISPECIES: HU family DNA-binding protein [unclassified Pseudomonas]|uniref:HU family DNA-binding protein n=1 Tax=unclassified Pseudomonas TaxID=196821 RepID=UPI00257B5A43|nr:MULTISPECIES: HU family DNA-binding protein [unclassified Pseudomonas]